MSKPKRLYIFGAGSQGLVVAEAAQASGNFEIAGFIDENPPAPASMPPLQTLAKGPVLTPGDIQPQPDARIIVAVGDNAVRARITRMLLAQQWSLATVIHPTAWVSPTAVIGQGVYVGPQAAINALAKVEQGVIVNTGAVIEHHCHVQSFAHCCPRSVMAGRVVLGSMTLLGTGASVRPRVTIGRDCVIGAGAAVVHDIPDSRLAMGVPAQCFDPQAQNTMV